MYKIVYCVQDNLAHLEQAKKQLENLFTTHQIICINDAEELSHTDDDEHAAEIYAAMNKIYLALLINI